MFHVHISAQSLSVVTKSFRDVPLSLHANPELERQNILRPLPSILLDTSNPTIRKYADRLPDSVTKET